MRCQKRWTMCLSTRKPMIKYKSQRTITCERLLRHPEQFTYWGGHMKLRPYQEEAIRAVVKSVRRRGGLSFVWIFPRQSGKDEALASMVAYLLTHSSKAGGEMVFINPTFKPQTETSMRRLERRLQTNGLTRGRWQRKSGYIYNIGNSFCTYLSADPSANIVGATANRLLIVNESQNISTFKYDKDLDPMAASGNATKLFSGTRWTSDTLLEREYQHAMEEEKQDGIRRVFFFTAEDVRAASTDYGKYVDGVIARLGRQHPLVRTQYFCETIDAQAGMFPPGRQALMRGEHRARTEPEPGKTYAFLVDVAGQDECSTKAFCEGAFHATAGTGETPEQDPGRDSTALKIVEVDTSTVALLGKPTYLTVFRKEWKGEKHVTVFGALNGLAQTWKPMRIVIDATGVGEGLWSLLDHSLGPEVVIPVKFTAKLKSELGYGLIGIVESGRYREYHPFPENLHMQMDKCRCEIVPGPAELMRWGVPDGTRDQNSGELVHDDDLMTAALCTLLDRMDWQTGLKTVIVPGKDPLEEIDGRY